MTEDKRYALSSDRQRIARDLFGLLSAQVFNDFRLALMEAVSLREAATPAEVVDFVNPAYSNYIAGRGLLDGFDLRAVYDVLLPEQGAEAAWQLQVALFQRGETPSQFNPDDTGRPHPLFSLGPEGA